jgi:hypothetical protein
MVILSSRRFSKIETIQNGITGFLDFFHHLVFRRTIKNTMFEKLICFRPQVRWRETPTLFHVLVRVTEVSYFQWTQQRRCLPPPHLRMETDSVSITLCSLERQTMDKVRKTKYLPLELQQCFPWYNRFNEYFIVRKR